MTIIAECGINWKADFTLAQELVMEAKVNGADLAKFQLYDTEAFPGGKADKDYAINKRHELTFEQAKHLFEYGGEIGIEVFFSVFNVERVKWCEEIGVKRYKIASRLVGNDVMQAIRDTGKPIIRSYSKDDCYLQNAFYNHLESNVSSLYCVREYPAELDRLDFRDNPFEATIYGEFDGFSDHTIGLDAAKIALARGAGIIEKHFCLTREGQDDNAGIAGSMTPDELRELKRFELVCKEVLGSKLEEARKRKYEEHLKYKNVNWDG